ncbi:unnamed protein product [Phytophthora fragariaefolia]|uniref:Unnamed protein product n=1 Tax=Phytophthora fragariaefolia TaxID=1490495 RepID=A0A9W6Y4H7_9STRA|nr:unnamed protein product [Phytophthora fragariaefolia]
MSMCTIYRQMEDLVDIFVQIVTQPGGNALNYFMIQQTATSIMSIGKRMDVAQNKKLFWLMKKNSSKSARPTTPNASNLSFLGQMSDDESVEILDESEDELYASRLKPGQFNDALQISPRSLCSTTSTSSLSGKDALVLMPTDGGKSLCYYALVLMPTDGGKSLCLLLLRGLVVVVSPLLALMQDQMAALRRKRIGVEMLSSKGQRERVVARLLQQYEAEPPADAECIEMLYTTPPTLQGEQMQSLLQHLERRGGLALFAVDEAHCISSWGHD